MKTKKLFHMACSMLLLAGAASISACSTDDYSDDFSGLDSAYSFSSGESGPDTGNGNDSTQVNTQAGIVTAGEWSDLNHWPFWSKLMLSNDFAEKSDYWRFYTNNRVSVKVTDESGNALAGINVKLLRQSDKSQSVLWETVTDNHGLAECWIGLYQKETIDPSLLQVSVNGDIMPGHPYICPWDSLSPNTNTDALPPSAINHYVCSKASKATQQADIAFIVDATGSMYDEIDFLKSDLTDIIGNVKSVRPSLTMRTAALFYRDEGDEYLTRHSDFSTDINVTRKFVGKQKADGGGDYPEAVHSALEHMLQDLSWSTNARTRMAFLILDAPAHHETDIISSLQKSIATCAKQGIRLIPVAASGVDKNTEFMLRFFAVTTGGTYVFITNDSGVGNDHIAASVGKYEVEQLNRLIIRLIDYYTE